MKTILAVMIVSSAVAQQRAPLPSFEEVLPKIAAFQIGDDEAILLQFDALVSLGSASPDKTKSMEQAMLRALDGATIRGKDRICRKLMLVGSAASTPALVKLLGAAETADMARYALERIPGASVSLALRDMLPKTSGKAKAGVVNTLGRRRDAGSVPAIRGLINDPDPMVASAAVAALGNIGDAAATSALASARPKMTGKLRVEADEAYLACAEHMLRRNDQAGAFTIYKELAASSEAEPTRVAGLRGAGIAGGKSSVALLTAGMKSGEPRIATQSIRSLSAIPGADVTAALGQALSSGLPELAKVQILAALADRGDKAALPFLAGALKDNAQGVRAAALLAIGKAGDASSVSTLAETAARYAEAGAPSSAAEAPVRSGGFPNERQIGPVGDLTELAAAREALARLRGTNVDSTILAGISTAAPEVKIELIGAVSERGIRTATPALLKSATDADRDVRRASIRALRNTAGPSDVDALLPMMAKASTADRVELARVVSSALRRSDSATVQPVMSLYGSTTDADLRGSLLAVLAQVGKDESLPVLRSALKDSNPEIRRGAIRALSDWPNTTPMPDLREIAKNDTNPAFQALSLQGFIKLAAIPETRTPVQMVGLLAEAMSLAKRAEEKRSVLAALQSLPIPEALTIAEAAAKDPSVAAEATAAADRIRQRMAPRRRQQ